MASGDFYRTKAAQLRAKGRRDPWIQAELEGIAAAYLRLAEQAERSYGSESFGQIHRCAIFHSSRWRPT